MLSNNNPFKRIVPAEDLPESHKKQVLDTVDTAKFLLEIANLFTLQQAETNVNLLSTLIDSPNTTNKDDFKRPQ